MKLENTIRILAGTLILLTLALAHWVNPYWIWLAVFVGINLVQSALHWLLPAEKILLKLGIDQGGAK